MAAFLHGFLLSLSLCMDLGLVNIVTLRISLSRNATAAFFLGLGSVVGDLVYFALAVMGATALLGSRPVRLGLWIFGTITLLVLAIRAVREVLHPKMLAMDGKLPDSKGGLAKLFVTGVGLALASPSAILWFAAVGGSVIASYGSPDGDNRRTFLFFAAGFALAGVAWAAAFAYGAAALKHWLGWRLAKGLSFASALLFLYFAADVFVRGLREFR
ncbi:MAG: LysE family transporter [Acidobacteriota bacterium]